MKFIEFFSEFSNSFSEADSPTQNQILCRVNLIPDLSIVSRETYNRPKGGLRAGHSMHVLYLNIQMLN